MEYIEIAQAMERIIHKYNCSEEIKRSYGTDKILTRKEIHTIQLIGQYDGINLKNLADKQGVTKGAASQMVGKLVDKGFVDRKGSQHSNAEVCLHLTKSGMHAFNGHKEYHNSKGELWRTVLDDMSDEGRAELKKFMESIENILDKESGKSEE